MIRFAICVSGVKKTNVENNVLISQVYETIGMIDASSKFEAEGLAMRYAYHKYPPSEGYFSQTMIACQADEMIPPMEEWT